MSQGLVRDSPEMMDATLGIDFAKQLQSVSQML